MNFEEILNNIDEFYRTADEKTLAKVDAAFSVDMKGDISLDEYLAGFSSVYFYTEEEESTYYVSEAIVIEPNDRKYDYTEFASAKSPYSMQNPISAKKMVSEHKGQNENLIKKAA